MTAPETDPIAVLAHFNLEQKTNLGRNVRALFGLLPYVNDLCTIQDIKEAANIHRHHGSIVLSSLESLGIAESVDEPNAPNVGRILKWYIQTDIATVCKNYNHLYAHLAKRALPVESQPLHDSAQSIVQSALRTFASAHKAPEPHAPNAIALWARRQLILHPEETLRRALGSFATAHDIGDTIADEMQSKVRQRLAATAKRPTNAAVPRQIRRRGAISTPATPPSPSLPTQRRASIGRAPLGA